VSVELAAAALGVVEAVAAGDVSLPACGIWLARSLAEFAAFGGGLGFAGCVVLVMAAVAGA